MRVQDSGFVFGFRDLLWVLQGECLIFGALCPSKTGLMNKHIVKHIVQTGKTLMELKPRDHALQTQLYLHVATARPNAQLDAYAPLISLDNSALHTLVPVIGMRGAWTAIHHTHS
jgi:hypothetical protein